MAESSGWSVLFLAAASPGQVVQFLERHKHTMDSGPAELLLSDAVGELSWRALVGGAGDRAWMESMGPALSRALAPRVTLLWRSESAGASEPARWGFHVWSDGGSGEQGEAEAEAPRKSGFLAALTRTGAVSPEAAWAAQHGLPADRVPALRKGGLRIIDFVLVARLDQKSLLVENTPRLYRFPLYSASDSKTKTI